MTHHDIDHEHGSLQELAELEEELLAPTRAAELRHHLNGCADCRARSAQLADTRAALSALPPERVPDDVAERVSAAVAAAPPVDASVVPLTARRRRSRPALPAVAAVVVLLAAVAAVVVGHERHHSPADRSAAANSAQAAAPPLVESNTKQFSVNATGRDYTRASLQAAIPGLLSAPTVQADTGRAAPTPTQQTEDRKSLLSHASAARVPSELSTLAASPKALLKCAAYVSDTPNAVPLTVDFARWTDGRYHAAPSVIFIFQGGAGTGRVIVTGPSCTGTDAVRTFLSVPLP